MFVCVCVCLSMSWCSLCAWKCHFRCFCPLNFSLWLFAFVCCFLLFFICRHLIWFCVVSWLLFHCIWLPGLLHSPFQNISIKLAILFCTDEASFYALLTQSKLNSSSSTHISFCYSCFADFAYISSMRRYILLLLRDCCVFGLFRLPRHSYSSSSLEPNNKNNSKEDGTKISDSNCSKTNGIDECDCIRNGSEMYQRNVFLLVCVQFCAFLFMSLLRWKVR